jgi:hypothetical protein
MRIKWSYGLQGQYKIIFNIPKVLIKMGAKLYLFVVGVPIIIQCFVEEASVSLILGLVLNQCMVDINNLLVNSHLSYIQSGLFGTISR